MLFVFLVQFCLKLPDEAHRCSDRDFDARHPVLVLLPGSATSVVASADAGRGVEGRGLADVGPMLSSLHSLWACWSNALQ